VTEKLMDQAEKHCGGRLVSSLEGGYDLDALGRSVATHVETLMGAAS
jgi:acetoin utilization deacetylase AcuC-like enzyme